MNCRPIPTGKSLNSQGSYLIRQQILFYRSVNRIHLLTKRSQRMIQEIQEKVFKYQVPTFTPQTKKYMNVKKVFNFQVSSEDKAEEKEDTKSLKTVVSQQIIQSQPERVIGYLKFYNESKKYGFFLDDKNNKDIFVHQDDFNQSCVDPEFYEKKKKGLVPYFSYQVIIYQGKTQQNVKAIDIKFEKYDKLK